MNAVPLSYYKASPEKVHLLMSSTRHHTARASGPAAARTARLVNDPSLSLPGNFVEQTNEPSTDEFVRQALLRRSTFKDTLSSLLQSVGGYSLTDANALVDRGRMFVFGPEHLRRLFGRAPSGRLLLDVGAGDGSVTANIAPGFEKVYATEVSLPMVGRLRQRGFVATGDPSALFDGQLGRGAFDLVLFLNVLDRASRPMSMLRALKALVKPGTGRILIAVVLPWCPFVERGAKQASPEEELPMQGGLCREGATFERSLALLAQRVLLPMGFEIEAWSRVPYISEGDSSQDLYFLDDALLLLKVPASGSAGGRTAEQQQQQPTEEEIREPTLGKDPASATRAFRS